MTIDKRKWALAVLTAVEGELPGRHARMTDREAEYLECLLDASVLLDCAPVMRSHVVNYMACGSMPTVAKMSGICVSAVQSAVSRARDRLLRYDYAAWEMKAKVDLIRAPSALNAVCPTCVVGMGGERDQPKANAKKR